MNEQKGNIAIIHQKAHQAGIQTIKEQSQLFKQQNIEFKRKKLNKLTKQYENQKFQQMNDSKLKMKQESSNTPSSNDEMLTENIPQLPFQNQKISPTGAQILKKNDRDKSALLRTIGIILFTSIVTAGIIIASQYLGLFSIHNSQCTPIYQQNNPIIVKQGPEIKINQKNIDSSTQTNQQKQNCLIQKSLCLQDKNSCFQTLSTYQNDKVSCINDKSVLIKDLAACKVKLNTTCNSSTIPTCSVNIVQTTVPIYAFCGNYQFSQVSYLNLNPNSCTQCNNLTNNCKQCMDKSNPNYKGAECYGCTLIPNSTIGACFACSDCTQLSYTASCQKYAYSVTSLNLDGKSCTSCRNINDLINCGVCSDKSKNGNYGLNCTQCTLTSSGIGICKSCNSCSASYQSATCSFRDQIVYLDHFYTGCQNCIGTVCSKCYDRAGNGFYGIDCTSCTITNNVSMKGYCASCRVCAPRIIRATCLNRAYPLDLNEYSCSNCKTVSSTTNCNICVSLLGDKHKGINCTSCTMTSKDKGICYSCNVCIPLNTDVTCGIPNSYFLAVNQISCSGCSRRGTETICKKCQDYLNSIQKGITCSNCVEIGNGIGYCRICAICYPLFYQTSINSISSGDKGIYINQYGCTECSILNSQTKCNICFDLGGIYQGFNCSRCNLVNETHGICQVCNVLIPLKTLTSCRNYALDSIFLQINHEYCSSCRISGIAYVCDICADSSGNGNIGSTCSICKSTYPGKGYCQTCQQCLKPKIQTTYCYNNRRSFFVNNLSCSDCYSTDRQIKCNKCNEAYGGQQYGVDCFSCKILNSSNINTSTGSCSSCNYCFPNRIELYCDNSPLFIKYFTANEYSCSNCSYLENGIRCGVCEDYLSKQRKGYSCSDCKTFQNKTYCSRCEICVPINIQVYCRPSFSPVYVNNFRIKQNSCRGCRNVSNSIVCDICDDVFNATRYGINCDNCKIIYGDIGYCTACSQCVPVQLYVTCPNAGYSFDKLFLNQTSCQNCSIFNNAVNCDFCYDQQSGQRRGIDCSNCKLYSQTSGICSSCSLCLPAYVTATCDNSNAPYRYLYLDNNSCQNCTNLNNNISCQKCKDKIATSNIGYNCRGCKQQFDGTAYCTSCVTCL